MSSDTVLRSILENARRELLDTTTRNRLLSTPRSQTRSSRLEIVDELSEQVFQRLVVEKKAMSFLPVASEEQGEGDAEEEQGILFQPGEDEAGSGGDPERHTDDKLQTRLTSEGLQKRLLKLFYDARTYQEEQGRCFPMIWSCGSSPSRSSLCIGTWNPRTGRRIVGSMAIRCCARS